MTNLVLLTIVVIGLVACLARSLLKLGTGLGIRTDLLLGIVGAFAGSGLLPLLGFPFDTGLLPVAGSAAFGAVALLVLVRVVGIKPRLPG